MSDVKLNHTAEGDHRGPTLSLRGLDNPTYYIREADRSRDANYRSWNGGGEGPTDDPGIENLRTRQVKNFLTVTMLSVGMPMMLMGDEVRRTQGGNNNAYCRNNETSWFDWTLLAKRADVHRFVSLLTMPAGSCATSSTSGGGWP